MSIEQILKEVELLELLELLEELEGWEVLRFAVGHFVVERFTVVIVYYCSKSSRFEWFELFRLLILVLTIRTT